MSSQSKGRAAGVLPVNAVTRKNAAAQPASKSSQRTPAPRLRLIIRRLPPGLNENEFWAALGEDWKVGNGKVECAAYKDGKVSRDPAKPSRPSRAYLRVKEQSLLDTLSKAVKESSFQDAKNTAKDPCLLGPPSLEFSPYNKTPSGRIRQDGRQGTIDQDQEFIDFLQSLTEPITKPAANGADSSEAKAEAITITPLVQYIKEKKANKAKEAAQAKAAKRESKEAKPTKSERPPTVIIKGKSTSTAAEKEKEKDKDKERVAKATQDAIKAVNKSVAAAQGKLQATTKAEGKQPPSTKETPPQAQAQPAQPAKQERNRERDSARAAARMLQRDLGLLAKGNTSPRTPKASSSASNTTAQNATPASPKPTTPAIATKPSEPTASQRKPSAPATPTTPAAPPTGPRASRTPSAATSASAKQPPTAPSQPTPIQPQPQHRATKSQPSPQQPSSGAKSAFLKHANPSQGITEDLLREAFKDFGTITRCEIDKKKGLGYMDFTEHEGLKKAMAASPMKVANGQVVVLENRAQHGKRGGGGAGQAVSGSAKAAAPTTPTSFAKSTTAPATAAASSPKLAVAAPTPAPAAQATTTQAPGTPTTTVASPATAPATPATTAATPPTAPRGAPRGGGRGGGRGNARSGAAGQGQGGRQGYRGGRGNFRSGARGGGSAAAPTAGGGAGTAGPGAAAASTTKEDGKKD